MKIENPDVEPIDKLIACNKCGEPCSLTDDLKDNYGLLNASFSSGYNSIPQFEDMVRFTFSLCEHCLLDFFNTFKNKPKQHRIYFLNVEDQDGYAIDGDLLEVPETPENINKQMAMMAKTMRKWDTEEVQSKTCAILTDP